MCLGVAILLTADMPLVVSSSDNFILIVSKFETSDVLLCEAIEGVPTEVVNNSYKHEI